MSLTGRNYSAILKIRPPLRISSTKASRGVQQNKDTNTGRTGMINLRKKHLKSLSSSDLVAIRSYLKERYSALKMSSKTEDVETAAVVGSQITTISLELNRRIDETVWP